MNNNLNLPANIVNLAINLKPKNHKRIKMTRAEQMKLISDGVHQIQAQLLAYQCLSAAVKEHSANAEIAKRAEEMMMVLIEKEGGK